jgi:hypothetical protein
VTVEVPGPGLVGDVKDELRSVHASTLPPRRVSAKRRRGEVTA